MSFNVMPRKVFSLILLLVLLVCGPRSVSQAVESKIYWTDAGTDQIQCANLDGSNVQNLIRPPNRLGDPHGIALDAAGGKIYWTDEGTDKIQCANLDGSNLQTLISTRDVRSPTSIALDIDEGKMYWIQTFLFSSEIWRANLNGSNQQRILRTSLDSLNGIALDAAGGKMYWTQIGLLASGKIRRANLNGSNEQTLVTGLGTPSGIALDIAGGKIYWTDSSRDAIQCANLDGSNLQTLVTRGLDTPSDIVLDVTDDKMYWTEQRGSKIRCANLDGSDIQTLVSGLSRPLGITFGGSVQVEASQIPESTPLSTTVRISLGPVSSPARGERFTLPLIITAGENVAGYQATVRFDATALEYVQSANGDYLPDGAFFIPAVVDGNSVTLAASSLAGESNGDGTLATITFEVLAVKASTLRLPDVLLTDGAGGSSRPQVETTQITETALDSPNVVFESQTVYDSGPLLGWSRGNSNSVAEVGERIELKVLLRNSGATTAENVRGVLTTRDTSVRILDSLVDYGNILPGFTSPPLLPTLDLSEQTFKIEIPDTATPHDVTLTLYVTADNAGPWSLPIIFSVVDQSKIQLAFPDNFISEEAFGPHTTYFTLKVQYPTLTNIPDAVVYYGSCNIILRIPERTQAFIFPIQTQGEKTQSIVEQVLISVVKLTPGISAIPEGITAALQTLELMLFFAEVIESIGLSEYDLKIALPTPLGVGRGHPDTTIDYVVLLKNEVASLRSIDIKVEQTYRIGGSSDPFTIRGSVTRNFGEGWAAAPSLHPIAISDYPPFQLLSAEVQDYLLRHFPVFANFEVLRVPKETSLLPNYPNPFNPETWIPYRLAAPADVSIAIYAADGKLVRTLALGHQPVGIYESRSRAAYWDGKNEFGERVASGVYFYTLTTGEFTATRKMLIKK